MTVSSWKNLKFGGGGYVPGLVFHPTSPDVLYARTDVGGAYRWNATTSAWVPITDGFSAAESFFHNGESIALDPNDDQRVYLSSGLNNSVVNPGRLSISTDRGDNWQHVRLPFPVGSNNQGRAVGERMMVDPNNPAILFYGSRSAGLWKSPDRGLSWQQVTSLSSLTMTQPEMDANNRGSAIGIEQVIFDTSTKGSGSATQTIYTAVAPDYAGLAGLDYSIYKTTNGGATWTGIDTPVTGYHIPHMVRAKDGMMYVAFTKDTGPGAGGPARLYKFDGSNWTLLKNYETEQWLNFGMGGLSVSGTGATTRIALGVTNSWGNWDGQPVVQLSDDAGATWREISALAPHTDEQSMWSGWPDDVEIDPNNPERILHVNGGGVWETRNASAAKPTWTFIVTDMEETATLALMAPPPGASYQLLNSSGDIGMFVHTDFDTAPVRGPKGWFGNGISADMAWSNSAYIAAIGTTMWDRPNVGGAYSTDSGLTWTAFPANHPDGLTHQADASSLAVTKPDNVIWAPNNSVPAYTTNGGVSWTYTNLPALSTDFQHSYRVVADRKNPNKVYAYDSGGGWWKAGSKFYYSTDGGHTFTASSSFAALQPHAEWFLDTSMTVNPYAEGDVWVADGHKIFHSSDSGVTWTKLNVTASIFGSNPYPEIYGATSIALGKAPDGAAYSAWIYVVGVIDNVWGLYRSEDGGNSWRRINDDEHQYGGIGHLAADHNVVGRVFFSGAGRGIFINQ